MKVKFLGFCEPPEDIAETAKEVSRTEIVLKRYWWIVVPAKAWKAFTGAIDITVGHGVGLYFGPTFVKEEFRGQGLQRKMMDAKLKFAFIENHYDYVVSSVFADSITSANNLIEAGFRIIPNFDYGEGVICLSLSRTEYLKRKRKK